MPYQSRSMSLSLVVDGVAAAVEERRVGELVRRQLVLSQRRHYSLVMVLEMKKDHVILSDG